ncbi:uncharacterized protein F4822DRAFT_263589 [Hypoxylon trugodes]|uniref:uncharacterized protein n=1 Tax=Hypoxylon trugodes TaxID=326681 RepID=UPI00219C1717|nr:uncharacterized protein F4822DRAFT_263589 [Hypoxylon trugodes]KAI1388959.1 hypothetical protein F4822DRAFT_263589 [Hypoxylon trugodes]
MHNSPLSQLSRNPFRKKGCEWVLASASVWPILLLLLFLTSNAYFAVLPLPARSEKEKKRISCLCLLIFFASSDSYQPTRIESCSSVKPSTERERAKEQGTIGQALLIRPTRHITSFRAGQPLSPAELENRRHPRPPIFSARLLH